MPPSPLPLIGHERQRAALLRDAEEGNVAHAYLFVGPRHLGKFTVAKWFAEELLCRVGVDRAAVAHLFSRNLHPDVLVLDTLWVEGVSMDWSLIAQSSNVPQAHRARSRAKTDTIQIDDVRALQQRLSETSTTGLRLLLIRSLERLHPTAANAMLHLLEEPPPRTVILCTTQAFNAVLPTVRSRMRHLTFHPLPARDLAPLVSHLPGSDSSFLLTYSQGAPGILLTLARDPDELRRQRQLASVAERLLTSDDPYESLTTLLPLKVREEASVLTHVLLTLRARLQLHGLDPCHLLGLRAALELLRCLQTNVQRELLLQRFVGQLAAAKMRVS